MRPFKKNASLAGATRSTPSPEQMQDAMRTIAEGGWEAPMPERGLVESILWMGELQRQFDELERRFNALQDYVMSEEGN